MCKQAHTCSHASLHSLRYIEHGVGGHPDLVRAASFYLKAAEKFGHFDSAHVLGKFWLEGKGVEQNFEQAARYLHPASEMGHWGRLVRAGFDRYVFPKAT